MNKLFNRNTRFLTTLSLLIIMVSQVTSAENDKTITIFMAGDSTMSIKHPKDYPETGWGMPFATFFNDKVKVENYAQNGRSTRTFREDGLWQKISEGVKENDIVIIQFGHNDEVESKVDRYTTPLQFKQNLTAYVEEVTAKNAQAILLTPITRRHFNEDETLKDTHPYGPLVREVAKETGVMFIDMEAVTKEHFEKLGDEKSAMMFMHLKPGQHPNYPNGIKDDTHFNELGARVTAQLFLQALKDINHPLVSQLRSVDPKHLLLNN